MKKIITVIADGFGIRGESKDNAISLAQMHTYEQFFKDHPHALLDSSQKAVGLLDNEDICCKHSQKVLGGGRVFNSKNHQIMNLWDDTKSNDTLNKLLNYNTKNTHVFCFINSKSIKNIVSCYNYLKDNGFKNLFFHLICFNENRELIEKICQTLNKEVILSIAGINSIDDNNEEGIVKYYKCITAGSTTLQNINGYLNRYDDWKTTYDNLKPAVINNDIHIDIDDNIIWLDQEQNNIKVLRAFADLGPNVYSYFKVDKDSRINYFIEKEDDSNSLGVYLGKLDVKQARVAQNDKADILFEDFDSTQKKISNCDRFKIDGIKDRPEMSIVDVTKKAIDLMDKDYSFIVVNFANADEYGQKGDMNKAIQACMSIDVCLAKLIEVAETNFYTLVFISDHGRIDNIKNPSNCSALVPFIISDDKVKLKEGGTIASFAPTILDYMEITIPEEMKAESLLINE